MSGIQNPFERISFIVISYALMLNLLMIMSDYEIGSHHIQLDKDVPPVIHPPRKVPVALKNRVKEELNRMEDIGVIAKQTEPTDWVNSMVTVDKLNKLRICIDPQDLNKAIRREHYPLRTVEEIVAEMPNAKVFSVLDANHGFWQVQLDDESSKLCTFNTPFGRYSFRRLPFGISSAPEVFQKCIAQRLEDLEGVVNIVDDILVWGENMEQHDKRLRQLLDRIRSINLKLNRAKCKIRMTEVSYVGHVLSADGLKPDPEKVRAIQDMPEPEDKAALMRFLGMLQYLAKFIPNLAEVSAPVRKLLESDTAWHWDFEQQESFRKLKSLVSNTPVLKYFDVSKDITLSVDASSEGLGAVILQGGQPVAFGSRLNAFRKATAADEEMRLVMNCVQTGWPAEIRHVPSEVRNLRSDMLERIHESHLGIVKCKERARDVMYWTGMTKDIEDVVMQCSVCNMFKRNNTKEPLISHEIPDLTWAKVGVDLFHYNQVTALKSIFSRHGIPDEVVSDNGPQFSMKNLLKKAAECQNDPYIALMEYRNAPLDGVKLSPAQLLMGQEGERVRVKVKDIWQPATVLKSHETPRSFVIRTPDGNTYRRNRRHLLRTREKNFTTQSPPHMEDYDPGERQPAECDASFQTPASSPVKISATPTMNGEVVKRSRVGRGIKPPSRYSP
ncbi:hypothetical protein NFI96_005617 [Prochilodus magdalenae]|nr:hypothetical protein NFI96_005617 [Prochilodus magdalenae]